MTYDREVNQIVTQDSRAWIAGLGDEGGAGSWLAASMKQFGQPNKEELDKYAAIRRRRALGRPAVQGRTACIRRAQKSLLLSTGPDARRTIIAAISIGTVGRVGTRKPSETVDRSYNYPHIAAANWVLYRFARNNQGLVTNHPWDWYLTTPTKRPWRWRILRPRAWPCSARWKATSFLRSWRPQTRRDERLKPRT